MNSMKQLIALGIKNKLILIRVDLNVPIFNDKISDFSRIRSVLPTIKEILREKGRVVICSHFGRPGGKIDNKFSLKPIVKPLSRELGTNIFFCSDCIGEDVSKMKKKLRGGEVLLLENLRFYKGEENNDIEFSKKLSLDFDYYINDAFSCSHRIHASIVGITKFLPSVMGLHLEKEISALKKVLDYPKKPVGAIVGGSKVSTKISLIEFLIKKMDFIIIGGAMANTFIAAKGLEVGKSLYEKRFFDFAKDVVKQSKLNNCNLIFPNDVVISSDFNTIEKVEVVNETEIPFDKMALDIGHNSIKKFKKVIDGCNTILWNGPLGAFEHKPFDNGTNQIASFVSVLTYRKKILSVAGGGDTISALNNAGVTKKFSYVSTAGGAFLEWLEGKVLPGIKSIELNNN